MVSYQPKSFQLEDAGPPKLPFTAAVNVSFTQKLIANKAVKHTKSQHQHSLQNMCALSIPIQYLHNTCPVLLSQAPLKRAVSIFLHPPFMYSHWRYSHELFCRLSSSSLSLSYRRDAPVPSSP